MYHEIFPILEKYRIKPDFSTPKDRVIDLALEVQRIDPNLGVVFVPRTLYDLSCIRTILEAAGAD